MDSHRKLGTFGALHVDRLAFPDDTNQSTDQLSSKKGNHNSPALSGVGWIIQTSVGMKFEDREPV